MDREARVLKRRVAVVVAAFVVLPLMAAAPSSLPAMASADVTSSVEQGAIPAAPVHLVITTDGAAPVVSKDDYVAGYMLLDGVTHPLQIKGRGNSTWTWPKKPYKLKLDTAAGLLGLPPHDEWMLLANYADRASLRNHLALRLAGMTRLPWSPNARFVDVVLNGAPQGLYLLTDQVEQGHQRVSLPGNGFLLEIDERFRAAGEAGCRSARETPASFKDPDELTTAQRRRVKRR